VKAGHNIKKYLPKKKPVSSQDDDYFRLNRRDHVSKKKRMFIITLNREWLKAVGLKSHY
jgi:hypothetical protein